MLENPRPRTTKTKTKTTTTNDERRPRRAPPRRPRALVERPTSSSVRMISPAGTSARPTAPITKKSDRSSSPSPSPSPSGHPPVVGSPPPYPPPKPPSSPSSSFSLDKVLASRLAPPRWRLRVLGDLPSSPDREFDDCGRPDAAIVFPGIMDANQSLPDCVRLPARNARTTTRDDRPRDFGRSPPLLLPSFPRPSAEEDLPPAISCSRFEPSIASMATGLRSRMATRSGERSSGNSETCTASW